MEYAYLVSTHLDHVSVEEVWKQVETWQGVNYELGPLVRMSVPGKYPKVGDIPADGQIHFTSWILLLGFIPVDRHKFGLQAIDPPNYFDERSHNAMMRGWTHKRTLTAADNGVIVTDACGFEPRIAILGKVLLVIYRNIFHRRHRRLARFFASQ